MVNKFLNAVINVLPNLKPTATITILVPVAFKVSPADTVVLVTTVCCNTVCNNSEDSVLLGAPKSKSTVTTAFSKCPVTRGKRTKRTVTVSTITSFVNNMLTIFNFVFLTGPLTGFTLGFNPSRCFLLVLLALSTVMSLSVNGVIGNFVTVTLNLLVDAVKVSPRAKIRHFAVSVPRLDRNVRFLVIVVNICTMKRIFCGFLAVSGMGGRGGGIKEV